MPHTTTKIFIDKAAFDVGQDNDPAKGSYLRTLGGVQDGFDLWLKGPGDDKLIKPDDSIPLENGMHFYSAKSELTPGHNAARG
jgi:hypothetical protein